MDHEEPPLTKEELEFLKPFKKIPKTRAGLNHARHVKEVADRLNARIKIDNELYNYTRVPLGRRNEKSTGRT